MSDRRKSTLNEKVEWLLKHIELLVGKEDVRKIALAMKHDGLLAKSTYWPDAKPGIAEAVKQARFRWYAEHNGREIRHPKVGNRRGK